MRHLIYAFAIAMLLTANGCCRPYYPSLPARPAKVDGWKKNEDSFRLTIGSFVLNEGESTENDKLGVTFVEFKPAILCVSPSAEPSSAKVGLRFYKPLNHRILCETTIWIPNGASSGGGNLPCPDLQELPSGLSIRAYNGKEKWVWLELSGPVGDLRW
jgi:hypothetical protein